MPLSPWLRSLERKAKVRQEVRERILELHREGLPNQVIHARLEVGLGTIREALAAAGLKRNRATMGSTSSRIQGDHGSGNGEQSQRLADKKVGSHFRPPRAQEDP
jgi:hypothetical protein